MRSQFQYLDDSYVKKWETTVSSVEKSTIAINKNFFAPQGGGQLADRGCIDVLPDNRRYLVSDVQRNGDQINITLQKDVDIEINTQIRCFLDWERRFKVMQLHSGEHALMGALKRTFPDIKAIKANFPLPHAHLVVSSKDLTWNAIIDSELVVLRGIYDNLKITQHILPLVDANKKFGDFRVKPERIKGDLRIIQIGDLDTCACAGTHVKTLSELNNFKIFRVNKRGEEWDVQFYIDRDADIICRNLANNLLQICYETGIETDKITKSVQNCLYEKEIILQQSVKLSKQIIGIKNQELKNYSPNDSIIVYLGSINGKFVPKFIKSTISKFQTLIAFGGGKGIINLSCASKQFDAGNFTKEICKLFQGGGGGKPDFGNGSILEKNFNKDGIINAILAFFHDSELIEPKIL